MGTSTEARDLAKHLREEDRGKVANMKRLVTFVGKFADWKRLDAVLYAAKEYEVPVSELKGYRLTRINIGKMGMKLFILWRLLMRKWFEHIWFI